MPPRSSAGSRKRARRIYGDVIPSPPDRRLIVLREAVGVVGAITAVELPRRDGHAQAGARAGGGMHGGAQAFGAHALHRAPRSRGWPSRRASRPACSTSWTGDAPAIGGVLTGDLRVRKFTFTGSTAVGKMLAAKCMGSVKRVSLELGGNAPFLVFDDCDMDAAVQGLIASKFRNSGQTCVCANRIYVQRGVQARFAEALPRRRRG